MFERLVSSGIPVDGIVRVLEEVGACLQEEPVRVFRPPAWSVVSRSRLVPISARSQCAREPIRQLRIDPGYARREAVRWQSFHQEYSLRSPYMTLHIQFIPRGYSTFQCLADLSIRCQSVPIGSLLWSRDLES